ncbi:MAG: nucleotidyltransferase domain-containing protein [Planctomycetes bacterium]|nr:nucleotidyltransferase domain-containing protein [Planctomycetota bacterium]
MRPASVDPTALADTIRRSLPGALGVWLFGSRARGDERPDSDVDLAVLGRERFDPVAVFELGLRLGVVAGRDVDLLDLRRTAVVLRKEIVLGGRRLWCADPTACDRFEQAAIEVYYAWLEEQRVARALQSPAPAEGGEPR